MERLTKRNGDGHSLNHDACPKHGDCYDSADCVDVLVNRLAAYEDEAEKLHDSMTASHSEAAILRGCIALMQNLMGRFEEYLEFIDVHPDSEEERFCTDFYMAEIVERLYRASASTSRAISAVVSLAGAGT